jgi:hypothetical protein
MLPRTTRQHDSLGIGAELGPTAMLTGKQNLKWSIGSCVHSHTLAYTSVQPNHEGQINHNFQGRSVIIL